jgi:hypothetical protein
MSMIGDGTRIVNAFCTWLASNGWTYQRGVHFVDIVADRSGQRVYAEAKGRSSSSSRDIDTLYGQLLRRMPQTEVGEVVFAVVVPDTSVAAAERVPAPVRERLRKHVSGVGTDGGVQHAGPGPDPVE